MLLDLLPLLTEDAQRTGGGDVKVIFITWPPRKREVDPEEDELWLLDLLDASATSAATGRATS